MLLLFIANLSMGGSPAVSTDAPIQRGGMVVNVGRLMGR